MCFAFASGVLPPGICVKQQKVLKTGKILKSGYIIQRNVTAFRGRGVFSK